MALSFPSLRSNQGKGSLLQKDPPAWEPGVWGLSLRAFLSSRGPRRGKEAASAHRCRGRRGQTPSLTILEGVDVAKNPQPIILPLGRHSQLLHRGAGLQRRDRHESTNSSCLAPTSPSPPPLRYPGVSCPRHQRGHGGPITTHLSLHPCSAGNYLPRTKPESLQGKVLRTKPTASGDPAAPTEGRADPPSDPPPSGPGLTWGKSGKWRFFLRCLTAPPHQSSKTCKFAFPLYWGKREGDEQRVLLTSPLTSQGQRQGRLKRGCRALGMSPARPQLFCSATEEGLSRRPCASPGVTTPTPRR